MRPRKQLATVSGTAGPRSLNFDRTGADMVNDLKSHTQLGVQEIVAYSIRSRKISKCGPRLGPTFSKNNQNWKLHAGTQTSPQLVSAMHTKRTSAPSNPPVPATLDRVNGHLATNAGVIITRLGRHMRGGCVASSADRTYRSELSARANKCVAGLVLRLGCQPFTPSCGILGGSQIPQRV